MNSTELYNRYISEQAAGGSSGDVVWSSSMDSALKLASDYALHTSRPKPASCRPGPCGSDLAYGTTYEPAVFIYNKRLIAANEVPTTHGALAKLIASQPDKFKNKVTTYDIEKSAAGFMLAVQDKANDPKYFDTPKDIAKGGLVVQSSTGTMMERVSSGENLIGYNILGSYAERAPKADPSLGAWPTPPTTRWCCRAAFISKKAKHRNAAKSDGLLAVAKGQEIMANQADLASVRDDIDGDNDVDGMTKKLGASLKPIPVNETLLDYLEMTKRLAVHQGLARRGRQVKATETCAAQSPRPFHNRISPCSHCAENGSPCRAAWWCWITALAIYVPLSFIIIQSSLRALLCSVKGSAA